MSVLPCTKEKLQRQKWGSRGRAPKSTGTRNMKYFSPSNQPQISSRGCCLLHEWLPVDLTALSPPAGESMCHPVLLRGTLTCLRIPRKQATRWPAPFEIWLGWIEEQLETIQSSRVELCAFLLKDAYFYIKRAPLCFVSAEQAPLKPMWYGYWLGLYEPKQKAKRKWINNLSPSITRDAYQCLYLVSIFLWKDQKKKTSCKK